MTAYRIETGWQAGIIGWTVAEHARHYHAHWGFGAAFEAVVANGMADFFRRYDPARDLTLIAKNDAGFLGTITIDGSEPGNADGEAHLRWFIISDAARGTGLGRRLMGDAMAFLAARDFRSCTLDTFRGLDPARHLYESFGFSLSEESRGNTWGTPVIEQRFDWSAP